MTQENIKQEQQEQNIGMKIIKINLILGNPKPSRGGWIYNISDDKWMQAINPEKSKSGKIISAYFLFEVGKKYLIKSEDSSWRNTREYYELVTLDENGELITLAEWSKINGNFMFSEDLEKHYLEFCATNSNRNVINFAKYLAEKL